MLDALSRSGTLSIECAKLHVVIGVTHCFTNSLMGTVIEDNVNPIAKVEKSSALIAATLHGEPPNHVLKANDVDSLTASFPELMA